MIGKTEVWFINDRTRKAFFDLKESDTDLFKFLMRAVDDIKQNPLIGTQIPVKDVKKEFINKWKLYETRNIYKYNLPGAWRLLYTITKEKEVRILAVLLDWLPHKEYEKIYKGR